MMTTLPNKYYSRHGKVTEEEGNQKRLEKKYGKINVDSSFQTAAGR